jgi:hypothetical protein
MANLNGHAAGNGGDSQGDTYGGDRSLLLGDPVSARAVLGWLRSNGDARSPEAAGVRAFRGDVTLHSHFV